MRSSWLMVALVAAPLPSFATAASDRPPLPPPRPRAEPAPPRAAPAPPAPASDPDLAACLSRIEAAGVIAKALPTIAEGECRVDRPLLLSRVSPQVAISGEVRTVCPMADALSRWAKEIVGPQAERAFGKPLAGIVIGTSYACRGRNRIPGAKLSEHGRANAVDVSGFSLADGRVVPVAGGSAADAAFVTAVRQGACGLFATVLGPGSDAYHADHLHLDQQPRRGGYRICQ